MAQKLLCRQAGRQIDRWMDRLRAAVENKHRSEKSVKSKERSQHWFANEATANQQLQSDQARRETSALRLKLGSVCGRLAAFAT